MAKILWLIWVVLFLCYFISKPTRSSHGLNYTHHFHVIEEGFTGDADAFHAKCCACAEWEPTIIINFWAHILSPGSSNVPPYHHKCMGKVVLCIFLNAVRTWKLWNASDSFACIRRGGQEGALSSKVCRLRPQRVQQHPRPLTKSDGRQKRWLLHSTCYLWESAALPSPSSFPARPGSTEITFCSRSAHARLLIKLGKWIPWGSEARLSVCLIYGPSLAWYNGTAALGVLCHPAFRGCHFSMARHERGFEEHFAVADYCVSGYN